MQCHIHAIGDTVDTWCKDGIHFYKKRFTYPFTLEIFTYPTPKRSTHLGQQDYLEKEKTQLLENIRSNDIVVCLDERGQSLSSLEFAHKLSQWQHESSRVCFLIGGPDGHHSATRESARLMLSLSSFTLPHGLARLVLVEQLYRAMSIAKNHPYHR